MRLEGSLPGRNNAKRLRKQMTPPEIASAWRSEATKRAYDSESNTPQTPTSWTSTALQPDSRSKWTAKPTTTATASNKTQRKTHG